ncbi:hypothetical protein PDIG_60110 [Penicillium digitatum PHI26]|uniref:Uncharacterized protein n=2 Tax=Penicillium digitatum TaxID=36651 RepID=K9FJL9_PEND2|nr:hypothetical protein PDIP_69530 [Penicillium digitatum Pd1]EKV08267.1 hypothetical protein PDIP_69530 [Penicillium digitatum Pd1]EKV09770.1 hypothetical protein PDIG_60110 [Penicillium digitatum PHI26]
MVCLSNFLFHRTVLFYPFQRRASEPPKQPLDLAGPLMDLSSLED